MHRHASGQAFARVFEDGRARNIYFGAYGSKEARTAYGQFLATYVAGEPFEPQRKRKLAARGPTVDELLVVYLAEEIAHRSANVQLKTKLSLRPLQKLYGTTDANAFGPARRCWWVGGLVLGQARSCKCEPATSTARRTLGASRPPRTRRSASAAGV